MARAQGGVGEVQGQNVWGLSLIGEGSQTRADRKPKTGNAQWAWSLRLPFLASAQRWPWRRDPASLPWEGALFIIQAGGDSIIIIFQGPDMCNIKNEIT